MSSTISLGFEINDSNFRTAIKAIDSEIKAMDAGIQAATKEISAMGESEEASSRKTELLTKMLDAQNAKLGALQSEYDKNVAKLQQLKTALDAAKESQDPEAIARAANAYNKQSIEVSNLEAQMNKTKAQIADTTAQMNSTGDASDSLSGKVEELSSKFDLKLAKEGLTAAREALEGFVNAAIDVGKQIWQTASDASTMADDMLTLSTQTGISTTALQEYGYASRFVDTEVSTITGSLTKLTKNMSSSSKDVAAAFDTLKVSYTDANGAMRSSQDVFWDCIDALGSVENATQRDQLAMTLFGKSAQDLNPLIQAGSEEWQKYCGEAHEAGLILSDEGMAALGAFNDGLQRVDATLDAAKNQIMSALAPAFETIANVVADAAQEFTKWVQTDEAQAMLSSITQKVVTLVSEMSHNLTPVIDKAKEAFGKVAEAIRFVIENSDLLVAGFKGLLAAIVALKIAEFAAAIAGLRNPIGLVITAVAAMATALIANWDAIKAAFLAAWEAIKTAWSAASGFFSDIWASIKKTFENVKTWFSDMFTNAWNAVQNAWNSAVSFFTNIWKSITSALSNVSSWFSDMFTNAWNAVQNAWNSAISFFANIWTSISNTFSNASTWFGNVFSSAWSAIQSAWNSATAFFSDIWKSITNTFSDTKSWFQQRFSDAWSAVQGAWNGAGNFFSEARSKINNAFQDTSSWFGKTFDSAYKAVTGVWNNAGNFFSNTWQTIVGAFKNGPSELLSIGKNLVKGLWDGIQSMSSWLSNYVSNFVDNYISGPIKRFFGIRSPSTYMRDEIGKNLVYGVVEGINAASGDVADAYKAMIPDTGAILAGADTYSVRSNVAARSNGVDGGSTIMLDDRPIILKLNDRELGRAVRGYA